MYQCPQSPAHWMIVQHAWRSSPCDCSCSQACSPVRRCSCCATAGEIYLVRYLAEPSKSTARRWLAPGHLASSFRRLQQQFISQAKYSCAAVVHVGRGSWLGTFYYIAAGVGSGIAEAQQVRAPHAACVTARCPRANQMPLAHGHVLLYLEQLACVAGEVHLRRCL